MVADLFVRAYSMKELTVLELLKKYKKWVEQGEIQFLKQSRLQGDILSPLNKIIDDFQRAEDEVTQEPKKGISDALNWYQTHTHGRELWQELIRHSLYFIDNSSKGNSKLTDYLDKATHFEELLYGLENYRDHTLHSLWVYLIGEYLLREVLPKIYANLNWYLYNDIEKEQEIYDYPEDLVNYSIENEEQIKNEVNNKKDAIWCVMALCHDLGYSLSQLDKLNERVRDVLEFFTLPEFKHIGYSLDLEHQYLVSQFLELMAMDVRIIPSENCKEKGIKVKEKVLIKSYRDDSTYWRVCRALEKKQHGILSSYLIYKILGIFADAWMRGSGEEWGLDDAEAIDNIIRGDILYGIAQHDFDFAHLNQLSSLADILMVADELEEFSRYGREVSTRQYRDTTANASIEVTPENPKQGDNIDIEIRYKLQEYLELDDLAFFFERKARKLSKIYSLEEAKEEKYCSINSIKIIVEKKESENQYYFHLCKDPLKTKASLPKTEIDNVLYDLGEYYLRCHDQIYVLTQNKEIPLDKWLQKGNVKF